jgi:Ca2+/Na+ antiporter
MSADIAMTKKGFGEMAITATLAGPVFNVLVGMAISNYASYANNGKHANSAVTASFTDSYLETSYLTKS